jgi:hypothetical protein
VAGSCENNNETSDSIKRQEISWAGEQLLALKDCMYGVIYVEITCSSVSN